MLASTVLGWPTLVTHCAVGLAGVSALALVLTQGRNEESFLAKAISGVVSLYGILGSYGMSAFLSDVLSYSRLLALGLATVVIGMAFNYIGGIMSEIPFVGLVLFIIAVAIGHTFNFFLSILGGFVHSVRLIFVELFSRFYEGGARPFAPLGEPQTVRIIDENL